jgi:hypothetical protein
VSVFGGIEKDQNFSFNFKSCCWCVRSQIELRASNDVQFYRVLSSPVTSRVGDQVACRLQFSAEMLLIDCSTVFSASHKVLGIPKACYVVKEDAIQLHNQSHGMKSAHFLQNETTPKVHPFSRPLWHTISMSIRFQIKSSL